jgi:hypothetical protein
MAKEGVNVDLRSFSVDVQGFAEKLDLSVAKATRSIAFALFERVIQRTPRVTGFLQAGWNLTIDRPNFRAARETTVGGAPGLYPPPLTPSLPVIGKRFRDYYVANGVPYAVKVDEGYPFGQAPEGIVRPALADLDFQVQQLFEESQKG